ncbi:hypothetical protein PV08_03031 [Exophiala spinifera]|uniref:Zn(2)-C6 fungal-type domain-containing protein n=1 Tax=Exophiala spinifera TaxID=91928 RepID=A0A0D2A192_9EURO|nr:uncharacterized protein PV08_03031 [Exophiala spinifera]KIW18742.1 hypothetical protein PV08_03031 [Exophiala spinifera]
MSETTTKKRNRITFSCTNCRHNKQKCNRRKPCMTCVFRGKQDSCNYGDVDPERVAQSGASATGSSREKSQEPSPQNDHSYLTSFGYSHVNAHNTLGIVKKLEQLETGITRSVAQKNNTVKLNHSSFEIYRSIIRRLPCHGCVNHLVGVFFQDFNWQYAILERSFFDEQLQKYYQQPIDDLSEFYHSIPTDLVTIPALIFIVLALALQFLPPDGSRSLHSSCLWGIPGDEQNYEHRCPTKQLLGLLGKDAISLTYIQAEFLMVAWLKNRGAIAESWHTLAQTVMDAQEIGLHRDEGKLYADGVENVCEQLWKTLMRRRTMLNLFLWDSEMGMVLGKSLTLSVKDCLIIPPTDCEVPRDRKAIAPSPRSPFDKPSVFTLHQLEYQLISHIHDIKALEAEGPYPRDYSKVERLHQRAIEFIDNIPPIYRSGNPDTSFDDQCPWLPAQREYLSSNAWLFLLLLHRTYIFSVARSRSVIMKAGIHLLHAQQRYFRSLQPHHYKLFTLAYISVDPAVSMLAVLITYPEEEKGLVPEAFRCIRETRWRLNHIRDSNIVAGQGADVIQSLLARAEKKHVQALTASTHTPASVMEALDHITQSSGKESFRANTAGTGVDEQVQYPDAVGSLADWPSLTMYNRSVDAGQVRGEMAYSFNDTPLRPTADLTYCDLAIDGSFQYPASLDQPVTSSSTVNQPLSGQFRGSFDDDSFWRFVNMTN